MYDLVIRNGKIIDGTGQAAFTGDLAVAEGRIVEIGSVDDSGTEELDAEGRCVMPGVVDGHTHLDAQVFWDPLCGIESAHGVTTVVMGNCGFSLAPGSEDDFDLIMRSIERSEDISRVAIQLGVDWSWTSFGEYLDAVERLPKVLNHAAYVGHSTIRAAAMGERAFTDAADADDLERICAHVDEALRAGAVGVSTSRNMNHLTMEGRPVASLFAEWDEVVAIAEVMRRLDAGTIQMTGESAKGAQLEDFHRRLWALSAESGRVVLYPMGSGLKYLEVLDDFEIPGSRVIGTIHARAGENIYGFRTTLPFDRFPTWKAVRSGSLDEQRAKLQDPEIRAQLVYEAVHLDYGPAAGAEPTRPDFDTVLILKDEGRDVSIGELARRAGTSPVDVIIDIGLDTNFDQLFVQPRTEVSEQRQMSAFRHPRTVIASSDAGAHISQLLNNDPTYVLSELVRERQLLTLEEAVKLLTADPASIWGFPDRGVLRAGNAADVVVFDEDTVGYGLPSIVNDLPDGGPRLVQPSTGIAAVIVNGEFASRDGEPTGARPGALLRQRA